LPVDVGALAGRHAPLAVAWMKAALALFQQAAQKSPAIRELAVRYNDLLMSQTQQSVACGHIRPLLLDRAHAFFERDGLALKEATPAACRRNSPPSTAATTRSRKSSE